MGEVRRDEEEINILARNALTSSALMHGRARRSGLADVQI
jgi:hypothetical protein